MKHVVFIVPDSTGIRNYLYSDIITKLKGRVTISVWSPLPEKAFEEVENLHGVNLNYYKLPHFQERILGRWFRETASFGRLVWNAEKTQNPTILNFSKKSKKKGVLFQIFEETKRFFGFIIAKRYDWVLFIEKWSIKLGWGNKIKYCEELLKNFSVDKVFVTHQRVPSLLPISLAAKNLEIEG
jgi:hypothetical protein